ncbi:uncharacterized protein LOC114294598 [Camellia sinensis]|uniref:uncharacterized protein LOC114294598 n=1 Tax=Camellia sinensis TaxID=4442 RepID=UPI0010365D71|nr:uncharacterized protein LOC114294598 [Camellia sinensis]
MWGIYRGLTVVLEEGLREIIVETDFTMAEELLTKGPPPNCPYRSIVEDLCHLIQRCSCTIQHKMREANQCADKVAKMGANQSDFLVVVEEPLVEVRSQILADMLGVAYRRL